MSLPSNEGQPSAPSAAGKDRRRRLGGYATITLLVAGIVLGIVFWGGFHTVVEWTNTEAFCISCHEMRDNVYAEYRKTIHYNNRTGVRAVCADCHVPREWGPKMLRKIRATGELWGKLMGTIDTREKFEANRLRLAQSEWARMKSNNSLECRNCHGLTYMDTEKQKQRARRQHELAQQDGQTCIDCHKGIAHTKPQGMKEED